MKEESKVKKRNCMWTLVVFAALVCLMLSAAVTAHAEAAGTSPCAGGVHQGPYYYVLIKNATCTEDGSQDKYCYACQQKIGNEPIIHIGHQYISQEKPVSSATCTTDGLKQTYEVCRVCGYIDRDTIQDVTIPAYGHKWDNGVVISQPTCSAPGTKLYTCQNDPTHTKTEEIPINPNAHQYGPGVITKQPDCTTPGIITYTCALDSSHTYQETIPIVPDAHQWDNGTVTQPAGCETPGNTRYTCKLNPDHIRDVPIAPTGHKWDKGTITVEPTLEHTGIKHFVCENDSSHTKDEILPKVAFPNNTLCAFGPRLRDVNLYPNNTDVWYMFTPFDASKDGKQTFELVASNNYIVGTVTLTIKEGKLTVDYTLKGDTIKVTLEFFTILPQIKAITVYEPEKLLDKNMKVRTPIDLEENFGEDRNLVLYFCSRIDYTYSATFTPLDYNSTTHQRLLNEMLNRMDK